jgi:hypothetical protein
VWENSALSLRPLPDHVTVCSTGDLGETVGEFRTIIAAVAGSCHVTVFQQGDLGEPVGEFRTIIAAIAGSCDCVSTGDLGEPVGEFRTIIAAVAGSCHVTVFQGIWANPWENSALSLRPLPDHVTVFQQGVWANPWENSALSLRPLPDHVTVFSMDLGEPVGEFRTNIAAVAGSSRDPCVSFLVVSFSLPFSVVTWPCVRCLAQRLCISQDDATPSQCASKRKTDGLVDGRMGRTTSVAAALANCRLKPEPELALLSRLTTSLGLLSWLSRSFFVPVPSSLCPSSLHLASKHLPILCLWCSLSLPSITNGVSSKGVVPTGGRYGSVSSFSVYCSPPQSLKLMFFLP